jgi:argininosuccinate lyase
MPADPRPGEVWRARLGQGLDPRARRLNDSLGVDARLWPEELGLTRAYAASLLECGVLDDAGHHALLGASEALEAALASGAAQLEGEDVHSGVEAELVRLCGDPARRLHTGRSRNDQVATLLRMRVMDLCDHALELVRELERALTAQARRAGDQAMAAHTHLQPAQPVLLAHLWLAHVAALERDETRFLTARQAADLLPLGAGAVAGTPLVYDRAALAARLGFSRLADNSVDAVGDRDFALEYLNAAALLGLHVSRLAEDLVLGCSPGFGWFKAPEGFATGSSLLPQKRNPDVFELARGKAARLSANAQRLAILLKGLPSAYQKDLQEDKEAVFDTADTLDLLLPALAAAIVALEPDRARLAATLIPDVLAVELADGLVEAGIPFRDAHAAVGQLWAAAEAAGATPVELPEPERLVISPHFTDARLKALDAASALARRDHAPGGGPGSVAAQLARHEARLGLGPGDPEASSTSGTLVGGVLGGGAPAGGALTGRPARDGSAGASARGALTGRPETPAARTAEGVEEERGGTGSGAERARGASLADAPIKLSDGLVMRRAAVADVTAIASLMADYVIQGLLLPRPVSELFQSIREFHVVARADQVVACAALRILWEDLGEVRSLAVRADHHGRGLGAALVKAVVDDAHALGLPRVIALTREVAFFERNGFQTVAREMLPRKVWTDCVRCPRRHACDEVAVVLDLVPGATASAAADGGRSWVWPIPQPGRPEPAFPIIG